MTKNAYNVRLKAFSVGSRIVDYRVTYRCSVNQSDVTGFAGKRLVGEDAYFRRKFESVNEGVFCIISNIIWRTDKFNALGIEKGLFDVSNG